MLKINLLGLEIAAGVIEQLIVLAPNHISTDILRNYLKRIVYDRLRLCVRYLYLSL